MLLLRFFGEEKTRRHGRNMDEKKKRNRHVALIVLILLLGIANGKRLQDRSAHIKRYAEMPTAVAAETKAAETTAAAGEESTAATLPEQDADAARVIDFAALKAKNPDVVAWLYVPGTDVNYPILYREADNEYYLRRQIAELAALRHLIHIGIEFPAVRKLDAALILARVRVERGKRL